MGDAFAFTADDIAVFLAEGEELLAALESSLLVMEASARQGGSVDPEVVAGAFRAAHTLKGSSAAVGLRAMSVLTHAMENVLDGVRRGGKPEPAQMEALLGALDHIRSQLAHVGEAVHREGPEVLARLGEQDDPRARELAVLLVGKTKSGALGIRVRFHEQCLMPAVRAYQAVMALEDAGEIVACQPSLEDIEAERVGSVLEVNLETALPREQVRARLESISDVVEVTISAGEGVLPHAPPAGTAAAPGGGVQPARGTAAAGITRSVRVDVRVLDELMNLAGELVIQRTRLGRLLADARLVDENLGKAVEDVGRVATQLQEQVMKARMLPVANLFRRFPRMVRDLATAAAKEVELVIRGEDTELDRAVLEEIGDPLVHILRNAVDHGLEFPAGREATGKPRTGKIVLSAQHEENYVLISVRDDGRGIDVERVRQKAIAAGLVGADEARDLPASEVINFIFSPGFSTADRVTEVSGRGVGLDVVRRNVQRVGGTLQVENFPGQGVEFQMRLPLTLAIIRCLLCQWGEEIYAVPLGHVDEVVEIDLERLPTVYQKRVLLVRESALPFRPLGAALGLDPAPVEFALVVRAGGLLAALGVTGLLGDQEVVVKDLGAWLGNVRGMAGATILGDGRVALILDVATLLRTAGRTPAA
ncbi:MAG: chemotaxis protein CheA [Bacillota bacterium]